MLENSGGRKQILEEENNCRERKLSTKCIDLHAPQYLMVDLAWYQRTMVSLDVKVPGYHSTTGMVPAYHSTTGCYGTRVT